MFRNIVFEFLARANHNFRGGGGRGSADVRDKIRNGEIALMAYSGDHRNFRCDDRSRHDFFVEGPQIFQRPAASRENNYFYGLHTIEMAQSLHNFARRQVALHLHRIEHHVCVRESPLQDPQDIEYSCARRGGDDSDASRQHR